MDGVLSTCQVALGVDSENRENQITLVTEPQGRPVFVNRCLNSERDGEVLGYVYPAYLCFKDIEGSGKPERLKLWCMYWVIVAGFTAIQPFSDAFLFFVPFYYSLKLAFACYLWANNLQGTKTIYVEYVRPFVHRHEPLVDFKLSQMKSLVSHVVSSNVSKLVQYVQTFLLKALSQQQGRHGLRADAVGEAAPAAGYARSDSFASAHSSGYFEKSRVHPLFGMDEKDE